MTYTKRYTCKKLFDNALKISHIMADIGVGPDVVRAEFPNLAIKFITKVPIDDYFKFVDDVTKLIDKMHNAGYAHGDLHLGNIINSANRVYIIDFDHSFNIIEGENDPVVLNWMNNFCGFDSYNDFVKWDYKNFLEEIDGIESDKSSLEFE
jgi:serine/threonine-protein kinase RIO1